MARTRNPVEAPGEAPIAGIVNRSMEDMGSLALLEGPEDEWLCPAAGIPLFQSFWARDSLTTALLRNAEGKRVRRPHDLPEADSQGEPRGQDQAGTLRCSAAFPPSTPPA